MIIDQHSTKHTCTGGLRWICKKTKFNVRTNVQTGHMSRHKSAKSNDRCRTQHWLPMRSD